MQKMKLTPEDAFGRVLRERRLVLGLTQADLESEGGLERSYISRLEAGRYQVCLRGILHLARALQMTPSQLMREVELRLEWEDGSEANPTNTPDPGQDSGDGVAPQEDDPADA